MGALLTDPSTLRHLVGKLNFLQHTRPDISYVVQYLSQFLQAPQVPHLMAGIHVLRYLLNAPDLGLLFNRFMDFFLVAFFDSDWAACADSRRSVTGFFITLGGFPVSWKSNKQPAISLFSAEVEYRALHKVVAEISWLVHLLADFGIDITNLVPVHCDSHTALHIAQNPVFHECTKHIEIDFHYVCDCVHSGLNSLHFVASANQLADIFTKPLPGPSHLYLLTNLGVLSPSILKGVLELHRHSDTY